MIIYYRRDGTSIHDTLEWARLVKDADYKRVAETTLDDGTWISTVWLGLDHRFGDSGPPLIFETMVFASQRKLSELDIDRYATEADASAGHEAMVTRWQTKRKPHGAVERPLQEEV